MNEPAWLSEVCLVNCSDFFFLFVKRHYTLSFATMWNTPYYSFQLNFFFKACFFVFFFFLSAVFSWFFLVDGKSWIALEAITIDSMHMLLFRDASSSTNFFLVSLKDTMSLVYAFVCLDIS